MHQQGSDSSPGGIVAESIMQGAAHRIYDSRPSALVICDNAERRRRLEDMTTAAGARLLGAVDLPGAMARLERIAAVRLLVVEAHDPGTAFSHLLGRIARMAELDGSRAVVSVGPDLIDEAFATLTSPEVTLLSAPQPAELAGALALALQPLQDLVLHDIGRESEAARLQRLSEEVSRIARALANLSGREEDALPPGPDGAGAEAGRNYAAQPEAEAMRGRAAMPINAREIRDILRLRRLRDQFFPGELFADPAWDMLLDLMAARLSGQRVSVSSLCIAAAVPATTALRWIRALTDNGLFLRQADPQDGRRVFIALSDKAADAMINFFAAARRSGKGLII